MGRFLAPFEATRASEGTEACRTDADGRKVGKPAAQPSSRSTEVLRAWRVPIDQRGRRVEVRGETVWKPR